MIKFLFLNLHCSLWDAEFHRKKQVAVGTSDYQHRAAGPRIERPSVRKGQKAGPNRSQPGIRNDRVPTGKCGMQE